MEALVGKGTRMICSIDPDDIVLAADVIDDAVPVLLEEDVNNTASFTRLADVRSPWLECHTTVVPMRNTKQPIPIHI